MFDSHDPEVGFGGIHGRGRRKQDPPIERELYLTLEEVFKGCVKKMKISRRVRTTVKIKITKRSRTVIQAVCLYKLYIVVANMGGGWVSHSGLIYF